MKIKKAVSAAKLQANQRNAQKSTGPRTPSGKANSRYNAVTHGLCAKLILLDGDAAAQTRLKKLDEALRAEYGDGSIYAELMIETITLNHWRQSKGLELEARVVSKQGAFLADSLMGTLQRYNTANHRELVRNLQALEDRAESQGVGDESDNDDEVFTTASESEADADGEQETDDADTQPENGLPQEETLLKEVSPSLANQLGTEGGAEPTEARG